MRRHGAGRGGAAGTVASDFDFFRSWIFDFAVRATMRIPLLGPMEGTGKTIIDAPPGWLRQKRGPERWRGATGDLESENLGDEIFLVWG